jgi:hypothetical protein
MPAPSSSNRAQLSYKAEGTYPTAFGVPQVSGNGTNMNMVSESLDAAFKNEASKTIRSDRQVTDLIQVDLNVSGGVDFELQYKEHDILLQGVLQQDYTAYGTNGVSAALTNALTLAAGTITVQTAGPTGNDALTNIGKGQWFMVIPPAGATQAVKDYFAGRAFKTHATTPSSSTVLTLDALTPIDTTKATTAMAAGAKFSTAYAANGTTMKSYTLEVGHTDVSQVRQFSGMVPSKLNLKIAIGSIVTATCEFLGKGFSLIGSGSSIMGTPVASQVFTPANAAKGIFEVFEGGAAVSATTYIKSADLTIDNSLRAQEAVGVVGVAGIGTGTLVVTGKLELYFTDATYYNKIIAGQASSLAIPLLDPDGNGYVIEVPRLKYTAAKLNTGGQDQDLMLSMDFQGLMDTSSGKVLSGKTVGIFRVGN